VSVKSASVLVIIFLLAETLNLSGQERLPRERPAGAPQEHSLCDVLLHPKKYSGTTLMLKVRITATKEGSGLWDPACPNLGVDLLAIKDADSNETLVELYRMLRIHGMSDRPVIAMLTGEFTADQYDSLRDRHRSVFTVAAAADITQTKRVEHRNFKAPDGPRLNPQ